MQKVVKGKKRISFSMNVNQLTWNRSFPRVSILFTSTTITRTMSSKQTKCIAKVSTHSSTQQYKSVVVNVSLGWQQVPSAQPLRRVKLSLLEVTRRLTHSLLLATCLKVHFHWPIIQSKRHPLPLSRKFKDHSSNSLPVQRSEGAMGRRSRSQSALLPC